MTKKLTGTYQTEHPPTATSATKITSRKGSLLNDRQAEDYLGLKPGVLSVWRSTKRHPLKYLKIGGNVRHTYEFLDEFLDSCVVGAENEEK